MLRLPDDITSPRPCGNSSNSSHLSRSLRQDDSPLLSKGLYVLSGTNHLRHPRRMRQTALHQPPAFAFNVIVHTSDTRLSLIHK